MDSSPVMLPGVKRRHRKYAAYIPSGVAGGWDYLGTFATAIEANGAVRAARRSRGLRPPRYRVHTAV